MVITLKKNKTPKNWNSFSIVVLVLLILAEGLFTFAIWQLKMLPTKYFVLIPIAMAAITGLQCLLLFQAKKQGKWQKGASHGKQIVAYILCAVIIAGCLFGYSAVSQVNKTISNITSTPTKVNVLLEIYVLADDPAEFIQDTAAYSFAISENVDAEDNQKAVAELESLLGSKINTVSYTTSIAMVDALFAGEVEAIILDSSYISILEGLDGYTDFSSRTRLLHEHVIEKDIPNETLPNVTEPPVIEDPSSNAFVVYVAGSDTRSTKLIHSRSDVNILVVVNPDAHQILLINTPRDTYVPNPAGNGAMDKLTHLGLGGETNSMAGLADLYDQPINYYARVNFTGLATLVDAIGGVTVYSDQAFYATQIVYINKGENHLNGEQALAFARERKNLKAGDWDRGKNQMALIKGIVNKLTSGAILTNYSQILQSLEGMFTTNMSAEDIGTLVQLQLSEMPDWEMFSLAITGEGSTKSCWAADGAYAYVMLADEDQVAHASNLIGKMLDGEVITAEDLVME